MQPQRYPNFDLLRLLAALTVVIYHGAFMLNVPVTFPFPGIPSFVAPVPAFLAISGVLVLQSRENSNGVWDYAIKRMLRLMPALIFSFAICYALHGSLMATNSVLVWLTGGLGEISGPANGPLWSLTFEEIAYAALAILWAVGAYRRPIIIWLLFGASLVACHVYSAPSNAAILQLPAAFLVGNLMYLHRDLLLRVHWSIPTVAYVVMALWGQYWVGDYLGDEGALVAEAAPFVWFGMAGPRMIRWRVPDLSYGLYIYHWPVLAYLLSTGADTVPKFTMAALLVLFPLAAASWYLIERPALRFARRSVPGHTGLDVPDGVSVQTPQHLAG